MSEAMTPREMAENIVAAAKKSEEIGGAVRAVFGSPEGQIVLAFLAREGFLLSPTAVLGDEAQSHRNEGARMLLLKILDHMRWTQAEVTKLSEQRTIDALAAQMGEA